MTAPLLARRLAPVFATALLAGLLALHPMLAGLAAWSLDLLHPLHHYLAVPPASPESRASAVAVVAITEDTYRQPPFAGTPKVFWTKEIARLIDGLLAADAAVIGLDLIFPTSVEPYLPGFERPFLLTLRQAAAAGRLVLGKAQHSAEPIIPTPAQSFAVGHGRNIRSLNLSMDRDGVVRHQPLFFKNGENGEEASMALELAARSRGLAVERLQRGEIALGGRVVATSRPSEFLLNFMTGREVPTYSIGEVLHGLEAERWSELAAAFSGRVVLIGTVLDLEDRWSTSNRLLGTTHGGGWPGSLLESAPGAPSAPEFRRESMAGVFIHATAVNNLLHGEGLRTPAPRWLALATGVFVLAVGGATIFGPPLLAAALWLVGGGLLLMAALLLVAGNLAFPFLIPWVEGGAAFVGLLAYRFALVDRQKLKIRRLFSLYTSPQLIEKMLAADKLPELGGEERQVTIWFSDLAGFTALSEGLAPAEVVALMNRYLTEITEIVEEHGGFVDKYIGDAVLAIFGAPHADPDHAFKAVAAALAVQSRLATLRGTAAFRGRDMQTRIGINTGTAMVGNIGSPRRFNYTVIGDAVNLASRLEGANKYLGSRILVAEDTVARLPHGVMVREIETIRVKGRQAALRVFEPLAMASEQLSPEQLADWHSFRQARELAGRGLDEQAAVLLQELAPRDPAANAILHRRQERESVQAAYVLTDK